MITQGNKTALNLSFPLAHATFKKSFSTNSPGYIVFCRRNASNCRVKDPRDSRYNTLLFFSFLRCFGTLNKWCSIIHIMHIYEIACICQILTVYIYIFGA